MKWIIPCFDSDQKIFESPTRKKSNINILIYLTISIFSFNILSEDSRAAESKPILQWPLKNEFANFLTHSLPVSFDSEVKGLEFAICNFDPENGLIYSWIETGMKSENGYPLPFRTCHTLRWPTNTFHRNDRTRIEYTQANRPSVAPAYLPDASQNTIFDKWYQNSLKLFYVEPNITDQYSLNFVEIRSSSVENPDGRRLYIDWSSNEVIIAFGIDYFLETGIDDFITSAEERFYIAKSEYLADLLESPTELDKTIEVITFEKMDNSQNSLLFRTPNKGPDVELSETYVYAIDRFNRRIIARAKFLLPR